MYMCRFLGNFFGVLIILRGLENNFFMQIILSRCKNIKNIKKKLPKIQHFTIFYIYKFLKVYCNYIVINLLKFLIVKKKVLDFELRKINFEFFSTAEKKKIKMHENA